MNKYYFSELLETIAYSCLIPAVAVAVILVVMAPAVIADYYSACRKANIYNRQNETTWTCSDFFWASSQINEQTQTINLK